MEENIESKLDLQAQKTDSKLELMSGKLENLEEKLTVSIDAKERRIIEIEDRLDSRCDDDNEINKTLVEHDKVLQKAENYVDRIQNLERNYTALNKRVKVVEDAEQVRNDKLVRDFKDFVRKGLIAVFGTALIGVFVFLIIMYLKSLQ